MTDLEFIMKINKITVKKACKKAKVDRCNLYAGRIKPEKVKEVRKIIESEIAKLYVIEDKEGE